ncbi:hypothetical protein NUW58_g5028 [Xylaria curta]|uniref:Uncharacterized protein n=1 Tax=Xylaria curta TaxID=42375 RepID=A0ACC1P6N3_9PEZI|nr:hypothetical protein NUW58_g5028 [Xylaria curta]
MITRTLRASRKMMLATDDSWMPHPSISSNGNPFEFVTCSSPGSNITIDPDAVFVIYDIEVTNTNEIDQLSAVTGEGDHIDLVFKTNSRENNSPIVGKMPPFVYMILATEPQVAMRAFINWTWVLLREKSNSTAIDENVVLVAYKSMSYNHLLLIETMTVWGIAPPNWKFSDSLPMFKLVLKPNEKATLIELARRYVPCHKDHPELADGLHGVHILVRLLHEVDRLQVVLEERDQLVGIRLDEQEVAHDVLEGVVLVRHYRLEQRAVISFIGKTKPLFQVYWVTKLVTMSSTVEAPTTAGLDNPVLMRSTIEVRLGGSCRWWMNASRVREHGLSAALRLRGEHTHDLGKVPGLCYTGGLVVRHLLVHAVPHGGPVVPGGRWLDDLLDNTEITLYDSRHGNQDGHRRLQPLHLVRVLLLEDRNQLIELVVLYTSTVSQIGHDGRHLLKDLLSAPVRLQDGVQLGYHALKYDHRLRLSLPGRVDHLGYDEVAVDVQVLVLQTPARAVAGAADGIGHLTPLVGREYAADARRGLVRVDAVSMWVWVSSSCKSAIDGVLSMSGMAVGLMFIGKEPMLEKRFLAMVMNGPISPSTVINMGTCQRCDRPLLYELEHQVHRVRHPGVAHLPVHDGILVQDRIHIRLHLGDGVTDGRHHRVPNQVPVGHAGRVDGCVEIRHPAHTLVRAHHALHRLIRELAHGDDVDLEPEPAVNRDDPPQPLGEDGRASDSLGRAAHRHRHTVEESDAHDRAEVQTTEEHGKLG